jgi:hypothetical protein
MAEVHDPPLIPCGVLNLETSAAGKLDDVRDPSSFFKGQLFSWNRCHAHEHENFAGVWIVMSVETKRRSVRRVFRG